MRPTAFSKHFSTVHESLYAENTRKIFSVARRELKDYHPDATPELIRYVLPYLTRDVIGIPCRFDSLAIRYGNKYIEQYEGDDQAKLVKGHMRLMMRVYHEMKQSNAEIEDFESTFTIKFFKNFICAAQKICKTEKKILGVPYNGHTIRLLWNRLFSILDECYSKIEGRTSRQAARQDLSDYIAVFKNEYLAKIGSKAHRAMNIKRRMELGNQVLPKERDIDIFLKYLTENRDKCLESLGIKYEKDHYMELLEYQMVLIMFYNGRRPGETDRTKIAYGQKEMTIFA